MNCLMYSPGIEVESCSGGGAFVTDKVVHTYFITFCNLQLCILTDFWNMFVQLIGTYRYDMNGGGEEYINGILVG